MLGNSKALFHLPELSIMVEKLRDAHSFQMGHCTAQPIPGFGGFDLLFIHLGMRVTDNPDIPVRTAVPKVLFRGTALFEPSHQFSKCLVPTVRILVRSLLIGGDNNATSVTTKDTHSDVLSPNRRTAVMLKMGEMIVTEHPGINDHHRLTCRGMHPAKGGRKLSPSQWH
ncbi:MAG: hypothetical protein OXC62_03035 [Aestuariivita sp.]|nr:hypothetical protein [Aestuariivita sp.]